jgi:hypothetical protein
LSELWESRREEVGIKQRKGEQMKRAAAEEKGVDKK